MFSEGDGERREGMKPRNRFGVLRANSRWKNLQFPCFVIILKLCWDSFRRLFSFVHVRLSRMSISGELCALLVNVYYFLIDSDGDCNGKELSLRNDWGLRGRVRKLCDGG